MRFRRLGTAGPLVSEVGLGGANFGYRLGERDSRKIIDTAIDLGVTLIDTADVYGSGQSETFVGRILGARRPNVVLATKFALPMGDQDHQRGGSRRWVAAAAEASLRRLNTDYIDLYQMHVPDPKTPIAETLQALDDLVRTGKVRFVGHCNFHGWQIVHTQWTARSEHLVHPVSAQSQYNLLASKEVQEEVLPACQELGLGLISHSPLASGFLTGKYGVGTTPAKGRLAGSVREAEILSPANFLRLARLESFARERGHTLIELAIGWLLSHSEVSSAIPGAMSAEQLRENVVSSGWRLDSSDMEVLAVL